MNTPSAAPPADILVIDDEVQIRRLLRLTLESAGYGVREAENGSLGLHEAAVRRPDAMILDLSLPDLPGLEVLRRLREWSRLPVLILSVRGSEADKIAALDAGADDYVTKPFATGELLARLRALLRARRPQSVETSALRFEDIVIDFAAHTVTRGGANVGLTRKEFDVLALLARHAGRLVTHRQLLTTVWGPAHTADTHYLRIAIGHIREKLGDPAANPRFIITDPGVGYRLLVPA